jgi:hypothetical protein
MRRIPSVILATLTAGAAMLAAACADSSPTTSPLSSSHSGTMIVRLTDAPFPTDEVQSVDIFVVRVDARAAEADASSSDQALSDDASSAQGWTAVATPNASFDLLSLQDGVTAMLGQATLDAGSYNGFRLVIDPSKSSVTLKDGTVLTNTSSPSVTFPSASRSGIKIVLTKPVEITSGGATDLLVDFDVENSFVMRGNSINRNGLLFKPVIKATVTNTALTNAKVQLINASGSTLDFLQNGSALAGGSNLAFGSSSSCSSVDATTPLLSIVEAGSTTPLPGLSVTLTAGNSFSIVAYPSGSGAVQFTTLANAFTPAAADAGLRVFNATSGATAYDVFVTAPGAPLGTPTVSNTVSGAASAFVNVPAGSSQIRLTSAGATDVLLDLGTQTLTAGQNVTLVIAPPAAGSTTPRAFLVTGC